jgi:hypothetical protein
MAKLNFRFPLSDFRFPFCPPYLESRQSLSASAANYSAPVRRTATKGLASPTIMWDVWNCEMCSLTVRRHPNRPKGQPGELRLMTAFSQLPVKPKSSQSNQIKPNQTTIEV